MSRDEDDDLARRGEDAEDAAVLREAAANPGGRGYLAVEAVERSSGGEHPVRAWREHRGMTARRPAELAGVDVAYLSRIETGKKPGSVKALEALAVALRVGLDDLA